MRSACISTSAFVPLWQFASCKLKFVTDSENRFFLYDTDEIHLYLFEQIYSFDICWHPNRGSEIVKYSVFPGDTMTVDLALHPLHIGSPFSRHLDQTTLVFGLEFLSRTAKLVVSAFDRNLQIFWSHDAQLSGPVNLCVLHAMAGVSCGFPLTVCPTECHLDVLSILCRRFWV